MERKKLMILVVSLSLILILAVLSACSGTSTATTSKTTAAGTTTTSTTTTSTTATTSSTSSGKTEIILGAVNSLTGVNVLTAQEQKWGQEQAVKDINDAGGVTIGGKKYTFKIVFEDDQSTAEGGASAMEKLIKVDKVDLALSTNITPINQAAGNVAEKYGVYYAINTSWTDFIASLNYKWCSDIFASTTSAAEGPFQIWGLQPADQRPSKIAVMTEDNPDGQGFGQGFKDNAAKYKYTIVE